MPRTLSALLASLLALCGLFAGRAVAEPAGPGVFSSAYQSAMGVWLHKEGGDTFMYFAGAAHATNLAKQKTRTFAWADRSKCAVAKTKNSTAIACAGSSRAHKIASDRFRFDPLMDSARLDHKDARLRWRGEDPPHPSAMPFADPAFGAAAFASVDRMAAASGTVLGTKMRGGRWTDMGFLSQGAYVLLLVDAPAGRYWIDPDTNQVHYRFRFEIAR
ncbi:MAG TPA: hypothetical protein VG929_11345 [Actinomycetota bacterium]|nr:hypothetical protein [Actinomycetota bacterium]